MSGDAWLTLAIVTGMLIVLVRDLVMPAVAVMGATVALLILGVIDTELALSGFSNPAPITVAALFVVARAVEKTEMLQPVIRAALGRDGAGRGALARLLIPTAGASAFLNNTPIVAMLAPQIAAWGERRGRSASALLMPLSFATILGGTLTLVGTSTNLVVSGLLETSGLPAIGMFEIGRLGLPVTAAGLAVLILLAPLLLPQRRTARRQFTEELREFVFHTQVEPSGPLDGRTVEEGGLRHLEGVFLVEIEREGQIIAPATPSTQLRGGDRLMFAGRVDMIRDLQSTRGLISTEQKHAAELNGADHTFFEAVVSSTSPLVGSTLKEAGFRSRYQAAVLAIHRAGERVNRKLGSVSLKAGDTLLLLADRDFRKRWGHRNDFLLVSHLGGTPAASNSPAVVVGLVVLAIVILPALGLLPAMHAALGGALLLLGTRVLTPGDVRSAVDIDVVVLIAAAFGIGAAIESSGLAAVLGHGIIAGFGELGPRWVLFALVLATIVLTELVTNNAAAVLVFPIALSTAAEMGQDPRGFAIAMAVAASASFLTPIGYQTNTMVYGMAGYRFSDFTRLGAPITLVVIVAVVFLAPIFWP